MSWATRARLSLIDGVKIDRFLVQLMASEHRPMAIDDLRGADALGLDVGQDLSHRVGRRTIGGDHHLKRLGVVHHRAEGLTELMCNRAGQRRHRLRGDWRRRRAPGSSGSRSRPAAVRGAGTGARRSGAIGRPARRPRSSTVPLYSLPQARTAIAHDAARRQPALGDAPPLQLAPVEYRLDLAIAAVL